MHRYHRRKNAGKVRISYWFKVSPVAFLYFNHLVTIPFLLKISKIGTIVASYFICVSNISSFAQNQSIISRFYLHACYEIKINNVHQQKWY